jgi:signal recognition particle receptor subunit beta
MPAKECMPFFDKDRQVLVVRVVYDGPPMSGKTTTLRSLAKRLGSADVSSPAEANGRTTFFDWTEYVGGLYEGRQIRCQIVSVPGQSELRHRRAFLLNSADAIVFVADTRASALPRSLAMLAELTPHCRKQQPPIGIVFQANKRDDDEALPMPALRGMLGAISPTVLVETVASDGDGVREAFVLAVRLALDRVRPLSLSGASEGPVAAAGAHQLLEEMLSMERAGASGRPEASAETTSLLAQLSQPSIDAATITSTFVPGTEAERVFVPNMMMPSGRIWPPVDGRALLHEVTSLGLEPVRNSSGDWWAAGGGWWVHSTANAIHDDPDTARRQLIDCARVHGMLANHLSSGRVLILADAGRERQRIWQMVRVAPNLHDRLRGAARAPTAEFAELLYQAGAHLIEARARLASAGMALACTLETIGGEIGRRPLFVGLMPIAASAQLPELSDAELLAREFGPALARLVARRDDVREVARQLEAKSPRSVVGAILTKLVNARPVGEGSTAR